MFVLGLVLSLALGLGLGLNLRLGLGLGTNLSLGVILGLCSSFLFMHEIGLPPEFAPKANDQVFDFVWTWALAWI